MKIHRRFLARSIGLLLTFGALFALTWYIFVHDHAQQSLRPPPKQKTAAELLIGTWEIVERDPPIAPDIKVTTEFTKDGKSIIRVSHFPEPLQIQTGIFQLTEEIVRFDNPENADNPYRTWVAKIETITDETLVLVSSDERTKRVVCKRATGN